MGFILDYTRKMKAAGVTNEDVIVSTGTNEMTVKGDEVKGWAASLNPYEGGGWKYGYLLCTKTEMWIVSGWLLNATLTIRKSDIKSVSHKIIRGGARSLMPLSEPVYAEQFDVEYDAGNGPRHAICLFGQGGLMERRMKLKEYFGSLLKEAG